MIEHQINIEQPQKLLSSSLSLEKVLDLQIFLYIFLNVEEINCLHLHVKLLFRLINECLMLAIK